MKVKAKQEKSPTVLAMREYIRNVNTIHQLMFDRLLYRDNVSSKTIVTALVMVGHQYIAMSEDLDRTLGHLDE